MSFVSVSEARLRQISEQLTQAAIEGASGLCYYPIQFIGEGGQGWVYRAGYDEPDGPSVVVKLLRPDVINEEALTRFLREADVLRKLGQTQAPSPNVVRFYDHGIYRHSTSDGETYALPFTVIEFVNGQNLGQLLAQTPGKGLAVARIRRLFRQVGRALSLIHGAGLVHRDLKPSNLLLTDDGTREIIKITDFGLVKRLDMDVRGTLAMAGASVGYAPPEQFEMGNRRVSPRTDLFAFATVLYEALTGTPAFAPVQGETPFQILSRILSGPRPQLASRLEALPYELFEHRDLLTLIDRELDRATRSDPRERHESILEFWTPVEAALRMATERTSQRTAKIPVYERTSPLPDPAPPPRHPVGPGTNAPPPADGGGGGGGRIREAMPSTPAAPPTFGVLPQGIPTPPSTQPTFQIRSQALLPDVAWAMTFSLNGRAAFALGRFGLLRYENGVWSTNLLPSTIDPMQMRGVLAMPQGGVLVYGERGQLWGASTEGTFLPWSSPENHLLWLNAVLVQQPAEILLVGEHIDRQTAVLGVLRPGQPLGRRSIEGTQRLLAVTRLLSGGMLMCGEGGELLYLGNGPPEPVAWGRTGHLTAILPAMDGGAHIVGTGGHALHVSANLEARLEPVQTTRDLLTLQMTPAAIPWAGGQDARLLRRTSGGWLRVPLPPQLHASIRALYSSTTSLHVLLEDGQLLEGPLA
ncbi:MAG: serine/threonine-protein kinase [Myxococcales bacterium]|nr:serine/threonine protein kinase [Polyangiaceae bacterium]MDW8250373.1 serine/threonine-protein kinase [Myxococcales bacterium]